MLVIAANAKTYAARTATGKYRTTPLRALWQHAPYFHDGSAKDLLAVVNHYDERFGLNLTASEKIDLVEYTAGKPQRPGRDLGVHEIHKQLCRVGCRQRH